MKILALDTSTEACSAALSVDGTIQQLYDVQPRGHTQLILPMVERLLADSELTISSLDAIAFGRGPGSFTGVRIAMGVVQGLAFASDLPVLPVSTLAAIAQQLFDDVGHRDILCAIDARMQEVYWAGYRVNEKDLAQLVDQERVVAADQIDAIASGNWAGAGSGWKTYAQALMQHTAIDADRVYGDYLPTATAIIKLATEDYHQGLAVDVRDAQPVYLRDKVAKKPKTRA